MENQERKAIALVIVLTACSLLMFDWEWPSPSQYNFSWAYTLGITFGMFIVMLERFAKHIDTGVFRWKKLIKTHLFAFLLFCPISVILILPRLNQPRDVWRSDYAFAFLLTYFLINVGPKIPTMYERLDRFLTPKEDKAKKS